VRRGDILEHYVLPKGFIDSLYTSDVSGHSGPLVRPTTIWYGHGGYGTPYNDGAGRLIDGSPWTGSGNVAQDCAGILFLNCPDGAPTRENIVKGMRWCEDEWTDPPAGGKRIYPGWI